MAREVTLRLGKGGPSRQPGALRAWRVWQRWRGGPSGRDCRISADRFFGGRFRRALMRQVVDRLLSGAGGLALGPDPKPCDRGFWTLSSAHEPRETTMRQGKARHISSRDRDPHLPGERAPGLSLLT